MRADPAPRRMTAVSKQPAAVRSPRSRMPSEERREQIIAAARRVFITQGLAGARTRDIAAEAGVAEALVYRHFRSKEDLFEAAVALPFEQAVAKLIATSGEPPAEFDATGAAMHERTREYVEDVLHVMDEIAPLLGVMMFGDAETARTYYEERLAPMLEQVQDVVRANLESWNHRDFDVELAVRTTFGAAWFHATIARLSGRPLDHAQLAEELTSMILGGLQVRNE